jgi:hypothetical protein
MRSCKKPAADARRHLGLAVGDGVFRACCLWSRRGRVGTSPVLPAATRVIAAGILTAAGVPVLEEDVPAGQNQARPPMYEMGGLAPASPRQVRPVAWLCWRHAPTAGAKHPCEGPGYPAPPTFPGSPPGWCPFPTVRAFLLPPRMPRKSLKSIISGSSAIHTVSTKGRQLSASVAGYPPVYSQPVHKLPGVTGGRSAPAVAFGTFSSSISATAGFWRRTRGGERGEKPPVVRNLRGRSGAVRRRACGRSMARSRRAYFTGGF